LAYKHNNLKIISDHNQSLSYLDLFDDGLLIIISSESSERIATFLFLDDLLLPTFFILRLLFTVMKFLSDDVPFGAESSILTIYIDYFSAIYSSEDDDYYYFSIIFFFLMNPSLN